MFALRMAEIVKTSQTIQSDLSKKYNKLKPKLPKLILKATKNKKLIAKKTKQQLKVGAYRKKKHTKWHPVQDNTVTISQLKAWCSFQNFKQLIVNNKFHKIVDINSHEMQKESVLKLKKKILNFYKMELK